MQCPLDQLHQTSLINWLSAYSRNSISIDPSEQEPSWERPYHIINHRNPQRWWPLLKASLCIKTQQANWACLHKVTWQSGVLSRVSVLWSRHITKTLLERLGCNAALISIVLRSGRRVNLVSIALNWHQMFAESPTHPIGVVRLMASTVLIPMLWSKTMTVSPKMGTIVLWSSSRGKSITGISR